MKKISKYLILTIYIAFSILLLKKPIEANNINEKGELRAVWITPITGDINSYSSENAFKNEMNNVLDVVEYYNLNTIFFHVRTHNNALYSSKLNPKASYWKNVNFDVFDPLKWLIEETKSRGIEFHAWMNPYRVSSTYYAESLPSTNPASDSKNTLVYNGATILNPGLPNVRQFVSDTILEFLENYDVDGIHFDDYFYINLGQNGGNIIDETQDEQTFLKYRENFPYTNTGKQDWRREQVNLMVELASNTIKDFNNNNDTFVQFGISPTGIYKNGNGVVTYDNEGKAKTNGSKTRGQTHYSSYLFSDSLKWINEGWLDYILPQSYWATNHNVAAYNEVMGWWNKVVKNLDVNLYSGIGLYMARPGTNSFNWISDPNEFNKQLSLLETYKNAQGFSIFTYRDLKNAYTNQSGGDNVAKNMNNTKNDKLKYKAPLPNINTMQKQTINEVDRLLIEDGKLKWNKVENAKAYYIYKSKDELMFDNSEIIGSVGGNILEFNLGLLDQEYNYGIKALSKTNHLSKGTLLNKSITTLKDANYDESSNKLTFYGKISEKLNYDNYGFYVIYGKVNISELIKNLDNTNIEMNQKKVYKKYVNNINKEGIFYVNLINIPEENKNDLISVVTFYEVDSKVILSTNYFTTSIDYTMNENLEYKNLDELKTSFLTDYHTYLDSNEDLNTFIHGAGKTEGFNGTWQSDLRTMYKAEVPTRGGNSYFINTEEYYDKWFVFMDFLDDLVTEINPTQSMWGSTWTGDIRIKAYFTTGANFTSEMLERWPEGY